MRQRHATRGVSSTEYLILVVALIAAVVIAATLFARRGSERLAASSRALDGQPIPGASSVGSVGSIGEPIAGESLPSGGGGGGRGTPTPDGGAITIGGGGSGGFSPDAFLAKQQKLELEALKALAEGRKVRRNPKSGAIEWIEEGPPNLLGPGPGEDLEAKGLPVGVGRPDEAPQDLADAIETLQQNGSDDEGDRKAAANLLARYSIRYITVELDQTKRYQVPGGRTFSHVRAQRIVDRRLVETAQQNGQQLPPEESWLRTARGNGDPGKVVVIDQKGLRAILESRGDVLMGQGHLDPNEVLEFLTAAISRGVPLTSEGDWQEFLVSFEPRIRKKGAVVRYRVGVRIDAHGVVKDVELRASPVTLDRDLVGEILAGNPGLSPEALLHVDRDGNGKPLFLTTGIWRTGFRRILEDHRGDFEYWEIEPHRVPGLIFHALQRGQVVGRELEHAEDVIRVEVGDKTHYLWVMKGPNGSIVTAGAARKVRLKDSSDPNRSFKDVVLEGFGGTLNDAEGEAKRLIGKKAWPYVAGVASGTAKGFASIGDGIIAGSVEMLEVGRDWVAYRVLRSEAESSGNWEVFDNYDPQSSLFGITKEGKWGEVIEGSVTVVLRDAKAAPSAVKHLIQEVASGEPERVQRALEDLSNAGVHGFAVAISTTQGIRWLRFEPKAPKLPKLGPDSGDATGLRPGKTQLPQPLTPEAKALRRLGEALGTENVKGLSPDLASVLDRLDDKTLGWFKGLSPDELQQMAKLARSHPKALARPERSVKPGANPEDPSQLKGTYSDGTQAWHGSVEDKLGTPKAGDWVENQVLHKWDHHNHRPYQVRVFTRTPEGQKVAIDIDLTEHNMPHVHKAPHYHVYVESNPNRPEVTSWTKGKTYFEGIPEFDEAGRYLGPTKRLTEKPPK